MKTIIYYSVQNGGDGSAYPLFLESKEVAEWDQDNMSEGWGEFCTGELVIEHDGPIKIEDVGSNFKYYLRILDRSYEYSAEKILDFKEKFFPNGVPEFIIA